nr:hypothetical protein [Oxalobacteraceae bacterium]
MRLSSLLHLMQGAAGLGGECVVNSEHGIGALKRQEILRYKTETEMAMMIAIKRALDPLNLMNPGKVV